MSDFTVEELPIPDEVDGEGWDDFAAMVRLRNDIIANITGDRDMDIEPREGLPRWHDRNAPRVLFVARVDGVIVGRAIAVISTEDESAHLVIEVHDDFRRRGIGGALYERLAAAAGAAGKTVLQSDYFSPISDGGAQLDSPSGFGSVAADHDSARFLTRRGYQLELVIRCSRLALPADAEDVAQKRRDAQIAAGDDYRVVHWVGSTPDEWLRDVAVIRGRIQAEAPHGDMLVPEDEWTEDRVRETDAAEAAGGRTFVVSAAIHVPTGRLIAFNDLSVPPELDRPVEQGITLVLKEHRGHRLGMLLKTDNIQALAEGFPGHPSITTMNAEENRPMLSVNEAVGFVATAKLSAWMVDTATLERTGDPTA
jgi:GNAT superfamily N-acetyltransferase